MQGRYRYNLEYFINKYRGTGCIIHECRTGQQKASTVDAFFETFGQQHADADGIWKLKVGCCTCYQLLYIDCILGLAP